MWAENSQHWGLWHSCVFFTHLWGNESILGVAVCGSIHWLPISYTPWLIQKLTGGCAVCWSRWRLSWQRLQRHVSKTRSWQRTLDERSEDDLEAVRICMNLIEFVHIYIHIYHYHSFISLSSRTLDFRAQIFETRSTITIMLQHAKCLTLYNYKGQLRVRRYRYPSLVAAFSRQVSWNHRACWCERWTGSLATSSLHVCRELDLMSEAGLSKNKRFPHGRFPKGGGKLWCK